jgi:hypothetical protein
MKKFCKKVFLFCLPLILVYIFVAIFILPSIVEAEMGPSTRTQIEVSFKNALEKDYELLILGNSRAYRGINPSLLDVSSYNFFHDNDTYNQLYYKLLHLLANKKNIKYLVLGVDYFQFSYISDTRNYVYSDLLGKDYNADYPFQNGFSDFLNETQLLDFKRIKMLKRFGKSERNKSIYLKNNGQYIKPGKATISNIANDLIDRIPIQIKYFERILAECKKKNIRVFICMMPARDLAMNYYTQAEILEFNNFVKSYSNDYYKLLDFTYNKEFKMEDYTDIKHLTEKGADKFTVLLNSCINEKLKASTIVYK